MAGTQFTSPVGRMVFGSVWEGQTTDSEGKPLVVKSGPNAGKPATRWSFGLAFPKVLANGAPNEDFNNFYRLIHSAGRAGYPQFYNGPVDPLTGAAGVSPGVTFATKIKDGDGFDNKGKQNNQKEGWAGHWVVVFSSQYAPRVFDVNVGLAPEQQLQDKSRVLPGDFVAVNGTVEANIGAQTPGVYVNSNMICFVGAGPRIVSGPKASDAFAGVTAGQLPPGCVPGATPASVAPVAPPAPPGVPVAPVVPVVPAAPLVHDPAAKAAADGWIVHPSAPGYRYKGSDVKADAEVFALYPAPVAPPAAPALPVVPAAPAAPVVPNHTFVANAATPVVPVVPTPPAPPVIQLTPTALAAGYTVQSFIDAGFTHEMMRQQGYAL